MAQFGVFQRIEENGNIRWEAVDHPFEGVLAKPHPWLTRYEIMYALAASLKLTGNHYWYLWPNALDEPGWLIPLRSDRMKIIPHATKYISHYEYDVNGEIIKLRPDQVVHFRNYHPFSDYEGLSDIEAAAYAAASDVGAQKYNKAFFDNYARPDVALEMPEGTPKGVKDEIETKFMAKYKGPEKAHGVIPLLTGGLKLHELTMSHRDAEFIEGRKMNKDDIFGVFGIPLGKVERDTTRANAEMADYTFKNETIMPLLVAIQEVFTVHLLPLYQEKGKFFARFYDVVPKNRELELEEWTNKIKFHAAVPNEWRAADGKAPLEGGDEFWEPPGMTGVMARSLEMDDGDFFEVPQKSADQPIDYIQRLSYAKKKRKWLLGEFIRMAQKRFGEQLRAILGKIRADKGISSSDSVLEPAGENREDWENEVTALILAGLLIGGEFGAKEIELLTGKPVYFDPADLLAIQYARQRAGELIAELNATSRGQLQDIITKALEEGWGIPETEKALIGKFDDWQKARPGIQSRAEKIARTELARAVNRGTLLSYKQMGVKRVKVLDDEGPNSCVECLEINGQEWSWEQAWGNPLQHPSCVRTFASILET